MNRKRRHYRRQRRVSMKSWFKAAMLFFLCMITLAVPIISGTGGTAFSKSVTAQAASGAYDDLALELVGATAFDDARRIASSDENSEDTSSNNSYTTFITNLNTLVGGNRWGNVGIFIGPKGTSQSLDTWSTFYSKVNVNESQIDRFDDATDDAFSKYQAFGGAIQKLNDKAKRGNGSAYSIQKGLDEIATAGAKLTNLGTELIKAYNPAPLVLALIDSNELNLYPDNKLVQLVNGNTNMREIFNVLGGTLAFGLPTTFVIMFFIAFLLLITSVLLTLINGRSAGENIRKAIVKVVIGCVAVPLIAKGLNAGVDFLDDVSTISVTTTQDTYIQQNLNLADWYATGFSIPDGTSILINDDGEFVMTPDAVKAINEYTYEQVTGHTGTSTEIMQRMEEYYNLSQAIQMAVSFSEPIAKRTQEPWKTTNYYTIMNNFGSNNSDLLEGIDPDSYNTEADNASVANVGYLSYASLNMTTSNSSGMNWVISGTGSPYGISPIAATNLMRTTFTGTGMTVNDNATIGGVVFNADDGSTTSTNNMNFLVRFLALFSIIMAGVKGLFTIFTAGFGGIIGGSAKSAMGMSTGVGQAIGGAVALIGGIFGISLIMTLSFTLLDQIYGVVADLITGSIGSDNSILDPFLELVPDIPILGPILERVFKSVASLILTFLAGMTLPKFGGIPVTLFCQYMAELPHRFAAEAQQIENKFTGDFRAGGGGFGHGGMANSSTLINQATNAAGGQLRSFGTGAATVAGALGGFGLTKLGEKLEKGADKESSSVSSSDERSEDTQAQAQDAESMDPNQSQESQENALNTAQTEGEAAAENEEASGETAQNDSDLEASRDGDSKTLAQGDMVNHTEGDTVTGKEEEKEVSDNQESVVSTDQDDAYQDFSDDSQISESTGQESSMAETATNTEHDRTEISDSDQISDNDQISSDQSLSDINQMEQSDASAESVASLESQSDHVSEKSEASMSEAGDKETGGTAGITNENGTTAASAHTGAARAGETGTGRARSMNGSSQNGMSEKGAAVRGQRSIQMRRALGKALQSAGGHTSAADAMAGVAAGGIHMAGSYAGADKVTQRGINAVREDRARRMDAARGVNPGTRRQRQANQTGANSAGNRTVNTQGGSASSQGNTPQARQDAIRNAQIAQEENYRQQAEAEEARRRQ